VTFEEFVAGHGQSLVRLAFVLSGDRHLAEDLTQTALADAYRHWRTVQAVNSPEAYVRRMLVNAHLSWRRRREDYHVEAIESDNAVIVILVTEPRSGDEGALHADGLPAYRDRAPRPAAG
jgi:DNA-directed RNA polymerase specialized sigma24 family protein